MYAWHLAHKSVVLESKRWNVRYQKLATLGVGVPRKLLKRRPPRRRGLSARWPGAGRTRWTLIGVLYCTATCTCECEATALDTASAAAKQRLRLVLHRRCDE
jgi:hypothetical protein